MLIKSIFQILKKKLKIDIKLKLKNNKHTKRKQVNHHQEKKTCLYKHFKLNIKGGSAIYYFVMLFVLAFEYFT